jgi:hypothetical protein
LHCWIPEQADVDALLAERLLDETRLDESRLDEDERKDDEGNEDETTLERIDDADEVLPVQIAPVTAGVSTAPLVLTCTPKETVWPGCTPPFQPRLVAEYGLAPLTVAFQLLVTRLLT